MVLVVAALSGCATQFKDIEVGSEADPDASLGAYESYMWAAEAAVIRDPLRQWEPPDLDIGAEIVFLVNRELRDRGYSEVVDAPGLLVIYAVGVDMLSLNVTIDDEDRTRFEEVPKGGVVVVLADARTRQAVWVGSAVAELLEEPDRELGKQRLEYAITKMFKSLPRSTGPGNPTTP